MFIFNKELGAKARALLVAIGGAATAVSLVAQSLLDISAVLPHWQYVGAVASILTGLVTFLGRFTQLGETKPV